MTPKAIKWLLYDLLRWGKTNEEIIAALQERGATYEDLVRYIVEVQS
jgi:hypothetical protein